MKIQIASPVFKGLNAGEIAMNRNAVAWMAVMLLPFAPISGALADDALVATESAPIIVPKSMVLTRLIAEESRQLAQIDPMLNSIYKQLLTSSPEISALDETYPGLGDAWKGAMRPIMIDEVRLNLPEYHAELAAFWQASFTAAELQQLITFWSSPTAQKLLNTASKSMSYDNIAGEMAKEIEDENYDISKDSVKKDQKNMVAKAQKLLTFEDRKLIARFELSPVGQKFAKVLPEKQAIDLKWFNKDATEAGIKRIDTDVPAAMQAHIAKSEKLKSAE